MPQAFYILFGALFTVLTSLAIGKLLLRALSLRFLRLEEHVFGYLTGSACLSLIVFALAMAHLAYKGVFLAVGLLAIGTAMRKGVHRPRGDSSPPLPRLWKWLFGAVFVPYTVLCLANAMAPEMSPDGSAYHLGLVARYMREHVVPRITTNIYASLSQSVEMLFLYAFAFGRHSSAALVHFSFLLALPAAMLAYAKRHGFPAGGAAAGLLLYASPVAGIDGVSAYNDVAVSAILFVLYYLLRIWDEERNSRLLIPIGLLAGFSYAAKYTAVVALPFALIFVGWKLFRARKPLLKPLAIVSLLALALILPWMVKNWIWLDNPFSPFFNRYFPNPYVHVSFEDEYSRQMRSYPGLAGRWDIPLEVTVRGDVLRGLLGPVFLLAPLGLFSLRERRGRQLLLAGLCFGSTYFLNIGTRFLLPALPFLSLAMGLVFARIQAVAALVVLAHALCSWPPYLKLYCDPRAWRLERIFWKQALRIESEDSFLNFKSRSYVIARFIEATVPPGQTVFSWSPIAEAYTGRNVRIAYQAASNSTLGDVFWTAMLPEHQPARLLAFRFPPEPLRAIRVVQTADEAADQWSIHEFRVYEGGRELTPSPRWKLHAAPNPWDVGMAFDNRLVTRWRTWDRIRPGMFVEADFGADEAVDQVVLSSSRGQPNVRLQVQGLTLSGQWKTLASGPQVIPYAPPAGLRRAAVEEAKRRGVRYLLSDESDFGAADFRARPGEWGITPLGERAGAMLYRLD